MLIYRLNVWHHEKMLGHFESSTPRAKEAVEEVARRFPSDEGYRTEFLVARDDRRIVESTPTGVRLISSEPIFLPI